MIDYRKVEAQLRKINHFIWSVPELRLVAQEMIKVADMTPIRVRYPLTRFGLESPKRNWLREGL